MLDVYSDIREEIIYPYTHTLYKYIFYLLIGISIYLIIRKIIRIVDGYFSERKLNNSEYEQYVSNWITKEEIENALGECHVKMEERSKQKNKFKIK